MWGLIFGGCFLAGGFKMLKGRVEDVSIKIVGMRAGLEKKGEERACEELWAPV